MKRSVIALIVVSFCGYSTNLAFAANCNDFRNDIQTIQQQVRSDQVSRATSGFDAVRQANGAVKTGCLDTLSSLDMTAFGLTPGAASVINKLTSAACQKLANEVSKGVGQVTQQVSQGVGNVSGQFGQLGNGIGGIGGQMTNQAMGQINNQVNSQINNQMNNQGQSFTGQISNALGNAWDSMKSVLGN